jgi:hypothetical protein
MDGRESSLARLAHLARRAHLARLGVPRSKQDPWTHRRKGCRAYRGLGKKETTPRRFQYRRLNPTMIGLWVGEVGSVAFLSRIEQLSMLEVEETGYPWTLPYIHGSIKGRECVMHAILKPLSPFSVAPRDAFFSRRPPSPA